MWYVLAFIVLFLSYAVGVFGFCQIVGSLQTRQRAFLFTIVLWVALLFGGYALVKAVLPDHLTLLYIGYALTLLSTLRAGKIE